MASALAFGWMMAAVAISVLLLMYQQTGSRPPPSPEPALLGITLTAVHLVALYAGGTLMALAAWFPVLHDRSRS